MIVIKLFDMHSYLDDISAIVIVKLKNTVKYLIVSTRFLFRLNLNNTA